MFDCVLKLLYVLCHEINCQVRLWRKINPDPACPRRMNLEPFAVMWAFVRVSWHCKVSIQSSADVKAKAGYIHDKSNVLYVANSMKICRAAFEQHQSLSVVCDEARTKNGNLFQAFASTPVTYEVAQGFCCPPQIMPDTHVCLGSKTVGMRIAEATKAAVVGTKMSATPSADPLVMTWNTIKAIENAIQNILPVDGLLRFIPESRIVVEGKKSLLFDIGGRQRWVYEWVNEDGSRERCPLLPGAHAFSYNMLPHQYCPYPPRQCCLIIINCFLTNVVVSAL